MRSHGRRGFLRLTGMMSTCDEELSWIDLKLFAYEPWRWGNFGDLAVLAQGGLCSTRPTCSRPDRIGQGLWWPGMGLPSCRARPGCSPDNDTGASAERHHPPHRLSRYHASMAWTDQSEHWIVTGRVIAMEDLDRRLRGAQGRR